MVMLEIILCSFCDIPVNNHEEIMSNTLWILYLHNILLYFYINLYLIFIFIFIQIYFWIL